MELPVTVTEAKIKVGDTLLGDKKTLIGVGTPKFAHHLTESII